VEERFGVYFLGYGGGTVHGSGRDQHAGMHRFADHIRKLGQPTDAKAAPAIKRRGRAEFVDSRGGIGAASPRPGDTEVDR
jgi:hypothetical protein